MQDRLLIGAYPLDEEDVSMLAWLGVQRVLNLVQDAEYRRGARQRVEAALARHGIEEHRLRFTDYGGLPADALEAAVSDVLESLQEGNKTYVHCRAGWQRSAAVAAGVVAIRNRIDIEEALALVKRMKPSADPLPHQRDDLRAWWDSRSPRP